jgi:hypothetical protein
MIVSVLIGRKIDSSNVNSAPVTILIAVGSNVLTAAGAVCLFALAGLPLLLITKLLMCFVFLLFCKYTNEFYRRQKKSDSFESLLKHTHGLDLRLGHFAKLLALARD